MDLPQSSIQVSLDEIVTEILFALGKIMYIQKLLKWEMNLDFALKM